MRKGKPEIRSGTLFKDQSEGRYRSGLIFQVIRENEQVNGDWWCRPMEFTEEVTGHTLYSYKESVIGAWIVKNKVACDERHILGERTEECSKCFAAVAFRKL